VDALDKARDALAPTEREQAVATVLNGIATLSAAELRRPLVQLVSVLATSAPESAMNAYWLLKKHG
jgi:hypothetical protein